MRSLRPIEVGVSHEELFAARYDALVRMARRIVGAERLQDAGDLVQETYLRFTLSRPEIDAIQDLDAYLYATLRNVHLSRVRRASYLVANAILDFDSINAGLAALDARHWLDARDTLRSACRYGRQRLTSSKAGSIFLLRFFHGFVPSETARLAQITVRAVDQWLRLARQEAKLFLQDPARLAFVHGETSPRLTRRHDVDTGGDAAAAGAPVSDAEQLIAELQQTIFRDRRGPCPSRRDWHQIYADPAIALTTETLAHLVTCEACLTAAQRLLRLPERSDRFPTDTLGPNPRFPRPRSTQHTALRRLARRAQAVFEHRPRILSVTANGYIVGTERIVGDSLDLTLALNLDEPLAFVELIGDQGMCLLYAAVLPPPDGPAVQRTCVHLSDSRTLEMSLTFDAPWPTIRATYEQPRTSFEAARLDETGIADLMPRVPAPRARSRGGWPRIRGWFWPRSPRLRLAWLAVLIWLLFFTPGTPVSAAEWAVQALVRAAIWIEEQWAAPGAPGAGATADPMPGPRASLRPTASGYHPAPRTAPAWTPPNETTRAALQLQALARLQQVGAYLGQEIALGQARSGAVSIEATVDTRERGREIRTLLSGLDRRSFVLSVTTLEAARGRLRQQAQPPTRVNLIEVGAGRFAAYDVVRAHVAATSGQAGASDAGAVDLETLQVAQRVLRLSQRASRHAWTLVHLSRLVPAPVAARLGDDSRRLLATLVREHARDLQDDLERIAAELRQVAWADLPPDWLTPSSLTFDERPAAAVWSAAARLGLLDQTRDRALRAAFVGSTDAPDLAAVTTREFPQTLSDTWSLCLRLQRAFSPTP
jgi:RNA polymerase sigma factor (sigma-70 family)